MSVKSYFAPEVIKTFNSNFNNKVQLVSFFGQLRLDIGDLTQSGQIMEKIWSKAFKKLLSPDLRPKKILSLGFGAGSATRIISKNGFYSGSIVTRTFWVISWGRVEGRWVQSVQLSFSISSNPNWSIKRSSDNYQKFMRKNARRKG